MNLRSWITGAALGVAMTTVAAAQDGRVNIPGGTTLDFGNGEVWKVVQCGLPSLWGPACSFEVYSNGQLAGGGLRNESEELLLGRLNGLRSAKGLPRFGAAQGSRPAAPTSASTPARAAPSPARVAGPAPAQAGQCPKTPYLRVPGTTPASTAVLRQTMASGHTFSRSSVLWAGVTFEAFTVGRPVQNVVRRVPGRGAQRLNDGAPPNAQMHPVRATYVLCEQHSSGPDRWRIQTGNYCFVDRNNQWACGRDGDVAPSTTTKLD